MNLNNYVFKKLFLAALMPLDAIIQGYSELFENSFN